MTSAPTTPDDHPAQPNDAPASASATPRRTRPAFTLRALWAVNLIALLGLAIWIGADGQFSAGIVTLRAKWNGLGGNWNAGRAMILAAVVVVAITSTIGLFLGLFFGSTPNRRIRSWFAFTLLLAAWLALFVSWQEFAWRGQAFRLQNRLAGFEAVAESLRSHWPDTDGERQHLGPFMAYPIGHSTMLMMLGTPQVPHTRTSFSSVERGPDGALRFELIGDEPGAWLEWHPPGSVPQSFVGGLEENFTLIRFAPLGDDWYLARYVRGAL